MRKGLKEIEAKLRKKECVCNGEIIKRNEKMKKN